ncbi:hypothetical protein D3C76_295340 [compost metagenome]
MEDLPISAIGHCSNRRVWQRSLAGIHKDPSGFNWDEFLMLDVIGCRYISISDKARGLQDRTNVLRFNQRLAVDITASQLVGPHQCLLIVHRATHVTTPRDIQFLRLFAVSIEVVPVE